MFHSLILPDGRQIPEGNVAIRHVETEKQVSPAEQLLPGGVYPGKLKVKLLDPQGQVRLSAGDRVRLLRVDGAGNARQAGVFYLEKPERIGAETLVLTGTDAVGQLDKDLSQWLAGLTGWPYTLKAFAGMVAERCGLTLRTEQIPNGDYPVGQFAAVATGRQLMRWICQACCRFCRATAEGDLELDWFTDSGVTLAPTGENFYYRGALTYADYATAPIDGVQLRLADGKNSCLLPETAGENPWILTANPFFTQFSQQTAQALAVIAGELAGLEYTPLTVTVPARDGLEPGQFVQVQTPGGETVRGCILKQSRDGARVTLSGQGRKKLSTVVSAEDKTALESLNAAMNAVEKLTQAEIFDKLTDGGKLEGLFMQDGQLYINASYLATGVIRSADGTVEIDLGKNTVTIHTEDGRIVLAAGGLYGYGRDGVQSLILKPGTGAGSATLLNSFQSEAGLTVASGKAGSVLTLGQPGAETVIRGSGLSILDKTVQWKSNGDGTYSLVGR